MKYELVMIQNHKQKKNGPDLQFNGLPFSVSEEILDCRLAAARAMVYGTGSSAMVYGTGSSAHA